MRLKLLLTGFGTFAGMASLVMLGALTSSRLQADNDKAGDGERIEIGLQVAPVHLTYSKGNRKQVGLGSYIVNVVSECNGCHSAGPQTQFAAGGNPYFLPGAPPPRFNGTIAVNPDTYLGGGRPFPGVGGVDIVSRNLTPDFTGQPEGGADFDEFYNSMRFGIDHDQVHPNMNFPFDGSKLQVMPWFAYQHLTNSDLAAIWEYLKAIPCVPSTGHVC